MWTLVAWTKRDASFKSAYEHFPNHDIMLSPFQSPLEPGVALALKFLGSMKIFANPFESAKNNF